MLYNIYKSRLWNVQKVSSNYFNFPGDGRSNEQIGLTTHHIFWLREHNRIEAELQRLNPYWTGEQLFQTTRRIIIAEWQFIIYNEYLPVVLGKETMEAHNLLPFGGQYQYFYGKWEHL